MTGELWCTSYTLIKITDKSILKKKADGSEKRAFILRFHP